MQKTELKKEKRQRRHKRIRTEISGTEDRPRLSIFKSNRYLYAQIIDDDKAQTLVAATTKGVAGKGSAGTAEALGKEIAEKALAKKIGKVVFDRGGFLYEGKIRRFADAAREGGLKF